MPIRFRVSLIGALAILTMLIAGCYPLQEEFVLIPTPVAPSESEAASETAAPEAITLEGTVAVNALRVRQRASAETSIIAGLLKDDIISVIGRTEDGSWLQVQVPDVGTIGWVWAEDVTLSGAADTLLVIDDDEMAEETAAEDKADDDEMTEETAVEETAVEDKADDGEMSEETAAEDKADDGEMSEETAAEDKADDGEMTEETAAEDKADDGEMSEETAAEDKADDGEMSEETAAEDKADDGEMSEETAAEDKADDGEMSEETAAEDKADDGEMSEETAAEDKADDDEMTEETAAEDKADDDEMAVEYDPSVTVNAQDVVKGKITVAEVVTQVKGWIVIHSDDVGSFGPIIGQSSLEAGVTTDLAVDIDVDAATETLYAMLHIDSGVFDIFEFPGPDNPVLEDSAPISMAFTVTINEMSMAEEGAGEEAMAEESPEETALIAEGDVATQLAIITTRSLRVRSKPETIAEVLAGVTAGEAYPVAGFSADGEWVAIFFPDIDDPVWVSASLVELRDTELIVRLGRFTVATAEDQRLRLRSEPTLEAPIVGHILRGESFSALGVSVDGAWTLLVDAGVDGPTWASTAFLLAEE